MWTVYKGKVKIDEYGRCDMHGPGINITFGKTCTSAMKKKPVFQINIASPCMEAWSDMTPVEGGRFCDSCTKKVIDFSTWTDNEIVQYVRNNQSACGRFLDSQLNRNLLHLEKERANSFIPALLVSTALAAGVASNVSAGTKTESSKSSLSARMDTVPSGSTACFPSKSTEFKKLDATLIPGDSPEEAQFKSMTWTIIPWGDFEGKPLLETLLKIENKDTLALSDYNTEEGKRRMLEYGIKVDPARQPDVPVSVKEEVYITGFFGLPVPGPKTIIPDLDIRETGEIMTAKNEEVPSLFSDVKYDGKVWPAKDTHDPNEMFKIELKPLVLPEFRSLSHPSDKKSH